MRHVPRVTIGVPVRNGEPFIEMALASLLSQSFGDFALVISDNASTDRTSTICRAAASSDPRIRYHRHDTVISAADNFACVLSLTDSELFMWAAHDDLWENNYLAVMVELLSKHPTAVLAFSGYDNIDMSGSRVNIFDRDWSREVGRTDFARLRAFIAADEGKHQKANHIYGLIRTSAARRAWLVVGCVDAYAGRDVCVLVALLGLGPFVTDKRVLFHYRIRDRVPGKRAAERELGSISLPRYLLMRVAGSVPGHSSNFLAFLRREHDFYRGLHRALSTHTATPFTRSALHVLVEGRRVIRLFSTVLGSAMHELRAD